MAVHTVWLMRIADKNDGGQCEGSLRDVVGPELRVQALRVGWSSDDGSQFAVNAPHTSRSRAYRTRGGTAGWIDRMMTGPSPRLITVVLSV